ncbi:hypothetical protein TL16_g05886 [Triparma laevis f. inornata]|uniref:Right handed beta helix domain-containing protein n=1 Tax=Triparma laevis f. inornata TaxID=1714386 RepID=A0A9W7EBT9_9STRA|nr:hypothetical protein TL16_g05886 [Triparma laevis f. inornata]
MESLPELPFAHCATYLTIFGIQQLSSTSKANREFTQPEGLWYMICESRGKRPPPLAQSALGSNHFRTYFLRNPTVPTSECPTLADAYNAILRGKQSHATVHVLAGSVLESQLPLIDNVEITIEVVRLPQSQSQSSSDPSFPPPTAALVTGSGPNAALHNTPLVSIGENGAFRAKNVSFFHCSQGDNIWTGNSTFFISGGSLTLTECSVQSSSGRGIVSCRGGQVVLDSTLVHDCAATGVYCGGLSSSVKMEACNVLRNGVGGREIPKGHSGLYIEASESTITDCFVSANSLTGFTLVRGGKAQVCSCDIYENGSEAFTVEDTTTMGTTYNLVDNYFDETESDLVQGENRRLGHTSRRGRRNSIMERFAASRRAWIEIPGAWDLEMQLDADHLVGTPVFMVSIVAVNATLAAIAFYALTKGFSMVVLE